MPENTEILKDQYRMLLIRYLSEEGEEFLTGAYDLGKSFITKGLGCLDLLKIHEEEIVQIIKTKEETEKVNAVRLGFKFFAESLSPFEMTHRGFYGVIEELRKQTVELMQTNILFETEIKVRKEAENRLSNSEKKYRSLIETARDVIYVLSPEGTISSLNPIFEQLTGWKCDEWLGKNFVPLVHPDDVPVAVDALTKVLKGDNPSIFELRIQTKQNGYMIGEFVTAPRYKGNRIIGALGIARDITERKNSERKLKESQEDLSIAQQMSHIGSWEWNLQTNMIHWSDELYRIYGLSPERFTASYDEYIERVHPDDRTLVRQNVERALQEHKNFRSEYRIIQPDGRVRTVEGRGEIVTDESSSPVKLRGTCQDITERKEADEAVRSLAKRVVEAQENERKRIARDLHDNICQRLSAVKLHLSALESEISHKRSKNYEQIQDLKKQISRTIKEVRSISGDLRPTTLDDLGLPNALQLLCREFEKNYRITMTFSTDGVDKRMFDSHRETALYRIAQEALMNIAKHAQADRASIVLTASTSSVTMVIRDNGRGFETGNYVHTSNGSGFGLMNMKERSLLLGATFKIESKLNQGTTVELSVPNMVKCQ